MIKEKIGTGSISSETETVSWSNESELKNIQFASELHVGDELDITQHYTSSIPGYCALAQIEEYIQDNLKGHEISQSLAEQYGIIGLGLKQIDYDVHCRDTLDSGFEVTIRYKVEELPQQTSGNIGFYQYIAAAVVITVAVAITGHYILAVIKEGHAVLKELGTSGKILVIGIAIAIASISVVYLIKGLKR